MKNRRRNSLLMGAAIMVAFLLSSCSTAYHCRKCTSGGTVVYDTLRVRDTILIAGDSVTKHFERGPINYDSLRNATPDQFPENPPCPELPPVMEVKKGGLSATIKQTNKGLDVKLERKDSIIYREKIVEVPIKVECPPCKNVWPSWKIITAIVSALFLGALLMRVFRG